MTQEQHSGPSTPASLTRRRRWIPLVSVAGVVALASAVWAGSSALQTVEPSTAVAGPAFSESADAEAGSGSGSGEALSGEALSGGALSGESGSGESPSGDAPSTEGASADSAPSSDSVDAGVPGAAHGDHHSGGSGLTGTTLAPEDAPATAGSRPGTSGETSLEAASSVEPIAGALSPQAEEGADRSAGLTPRGAIAPEDVIDSADSSLGGCLAEYGANGQCLPVIPGSMAEHARQMTASGLDPLTMDHPWSCAEVRQTFPDGLGVRQAGVDPQRLDTNNDGTACGTGD